MKRRIDPPRQQSLSMALGGASAKSASPATGMKRKTADEPTKKAKAKKDESEDSSRCVRNLAVARRSEEARGRTRVGAGISCDLCRGHPACWRKRSTALSGRAKARQGSPAPWPYTHPTVTCVMYCVSSQAHTSCARQCRRSEPNGPVCQLNYMPCISLTICDQCVQ